MEELRYERKYKLDRISEREVVDEVLLHPHGFRRQHPDRWINNVYFDSPERMTFRENTAGASERNKYRIRWYGSDIHHISDGRWEIKCKLNTLGRKVVIPFLEECRLESLHDIERLINRKYHRGELLTAALINRYLRSYFISADGHFRLTVDRSLFYFPVLAARTFTRYTYEDVSIIVELKYDQQHDDAAAELLRFMPFVQTKSSKYVTGMLLSA